MVDGGKIFCLKPNFLCWYSAHGHGHGTKLFYHIFILCNIHTDIYIFRKLATYILMIQNCWLSLYKYIDFSESTLDIIPHSCWSQCWKTWLKAQDYCDLKAQDYCDLGTKPLTSYCDHREVLMKFVTHPHIIQCSTFIHTNSH